MGFFKGLIGLVAVLAVIVLGGGYLLPKETNLSRSIEITAPADKIFPYVADLNQFAQWSPWSKMDAEMKPVIKGAAAAKGHSMHWESKKIGNGKQVLIEAVPNQKVVYDLDLEMGKNLAGFTLEPAGAGTKVTWSLATTANGPVERWFGLILDWLVGGDFETGLQALKAKVEGQG
jgi:uncharacterized protein YndB with AHSA1/START domain